MSQNINLYDPAFRVHRNWLSANLAAAALVAAAVVVAAGAAVLRSQVEGLEQQVLIGDEQLKSQQAALQDLAKQVASARPDPRMLADLSATQASLEQRRAVLQLLNAGGLGDESGYSATLQAVARQSLTGLWLVGLTLNHRDVAMRGRALNPELVPAFLQRLNRESALQGRSFRSLEMQRPLQAEAPPARQAPYVEFALAGADGAVAPGATKADKP